MSADELTLAEATTIAEAAVARSAEIGLEIGVVVMDERAEPLVLLRSERSKWTVSGIARAKAGSALAFGTTTDRIAAIAERQPERLRLMSAQLDFPITSLRGGVPIIRDGRIVGSVAVSGGTGEQDEDCAVQGLLAAGFRAPG